MAVLALAFAGSSLLLAGAAEAATPSALQIGPLDPAIPPVSYWTGTTKYSGGSYELNFTEHGSRLTYFFVGGQCKVGEETDTNFPVSVPIIHGKFALNFTTHRAHGKGHIEDTDPGFHVIIQGLIYAKGTLARGTLRILDDPLSGGACDAPTAHWQAHNDTATTT
jgi:hypothetical protein